MVREQRPEVHRRRGSGADVFIRGAVAGQREHPELVAGRAERNQEPRRGERLLVGENGGSFEGAGGGEAQRRVARFTQIDRAAVERSVTRERAKDQRRVVGRGDLFDLLELGEEFGQRHGRRLPEA